ncbi:hypothetical protein BD779DRAFT_463652 [Infundibulicybe gibba]|nr:hypothetical protein BD779DRAFT_463652 [Infundibulicybe gibba]
MRLFLSEPTPLNATYTNEMGQAIYKVATPDKLFGTPVATIRRIVPSSVRDSTSTSTSLTSLRDQFGHLAQVEWHTLNHRGSAWVGRRSRRRIFSRRWDGVGSGGEQRVFTAPDGKEYKWKIGMSSSTLRAIDSTAARIAKYRQKNYIINRRPASLEISPAGEHIMDTILVTFVYIEMVRQDEESMAASG